MVVLDGKTLNIDRLVRIAFRRERIRIHNTQWSKIHRAHEFVKKHAADKAAIYGINTGFGALAQIRIGLDKTKRLQHNLLLSHHAGVGQPCRPELVRAAVALHINALIKGYSGVSAQLIERLVTILNRNIVPVVPQKGSVGASGDLAPMAAIGSVLIGQGDVFHNGRRMSAQRALKLAHIKTLRLQPKEGLALINSTQFSTGIAGIVNFMGMHLCEKADMCGAMSLDALRGSANPFTKDIFKVRPHAGAKESAQNIRHFIRGSQLVKSHRQCPKVQDPYSLRCMAQVHGAVRDILQSARKTIEIEMNSVTDNPLVFPEKNMIVSSGNFHAEPIAFALDYMALGLAELSSISERRVFRLLDSSLSGLNAFLATTPGLNSGLMLAQTTAAALVSQNKILSHPASVDSVPTSANQEDHVSMSMNAGLKALEILENTKYILAIEMLCACQALDLLRPLKTSPYLEKVKKRVRKIVPFMKTDRPLTPFIEKIKASIDKELMV